MDRQKFLEQEILRHKELYYKGTPEVSDADFDKLEDELKKLNPDNPVLNVVGTKVSNTNKIAHETKMLSLDKTYSKDDLVKWVEENETLSMFKIDGVSCSLIYEDGKLILGKTRGDGSFGEDITDKILWIDSIPKTIAAKEKLEIRGELYCTESDFFHLSEEFQKLNL
ncbi:MAG: NAD-dependent DNA ligase LigA, partial [Bacteriovoracaceae bacterium]